MTDIFDMIHEATLKIVRGEVVNLVEASHSTNSVAIGHFREDDRYHLRCIKCGKEETDIARRPRQTSMMCGENK